MALYSKLLSRTQKLKKQSYAIASMKQRRFFYPPSSAATKYFGRSHPVFA
ncbi:hypothetical protein QUB56_31160 [Microcoleus sp. AR_TQ3_B6]